ncbi:MAG: hypothetical protein LBC53_08180 [Spirochaetaceae bacterium]|jgi:hypothetical protein|nr:hypothetical protein [Spirochaetaceae bacterium]
MDLDVQKILDKVIWFFRVILGFLKRAGRFFKNLNDPSIFAIWITTALLISALVCGLTEKSKQAKISFMVNRILDEEGSSLLIDRPLPAWRMPGPAVAAGKWYIMNNRDLAVVFPVFYEGIFTMYFAVFTDSAKMDVFLPLSKTAKIAMERSPEGYTAIQKKRIEKAAALILKKLNGSAW